MFVLLGLAVGLVFGLGSALTGRVLGTVLACAPFAAWFVALWVIAAHGMSATDSAPLALSLLGILLGMFTGQAVQRRRKHRSHQG